MLQIVKKIVPTRAIDKATNNLHAWDSLYESAPNPEREVINETFGNEDIRRGIATWAPAVDWNPFAHIKGNFSETHNSKPDPPIAMVRLSQQLYRPQTQQISTSAQIEESVCINSILDDHSIGSQWGPPPLLVVEGHKNFIDFHEENRIKTPCKSTQFQRKCNHEPPQRQQLFWDA